jgi:hypothetical protein
VQNALGTVEDLCKRHEISALEDSGSDRYRLQPSNTNSPDNLIPLRAAAPSRLPGALRGQLQERTAAHSIRSRLSLFRGGRKGTGAAAREYESFDPWPLEEIEQEGVPYSEYVTKMKLSPERQSLQVNECLTLARISPEAFECRLGSRSALEWVVDQYQVKGESDPNREEDPGYIARLVGQVVSVSIETVRIVKVLPACRAEVTRRRSIWVWRRAKALVFRIQTDAGPGSGTGRLGRRPRDSARLGRRFPAAAG